MDPVNILAKVEVRNFVRSWDNRGYWKKLGRPWMHPRSLFSQIFKRLLLGWTLWMYLPNLKFVALPVGEITGCTGKKIGQSLDTSTLPFLPNFQKLFAWMDPVNIPAKFEVRSFARSWDNKGYWKKLGRPWIRPRSLFSQIFNGLLLGWTLWMHLPNLKFVALCVPEIIGGTGQITWWRHLWRHEACINYTCGRFICTMQ